MEREIMPAVRAYRDYLATEYLPHARTTTALSALPHGGECYRALVRAYTTLDRDPTAVHQLGLREMERVERDMRTIAERSFGTSRSEEHTSELQSRGHLVCRLLLEKKKLGSG